MGTIKDTCPLQLWPGHGMNVSGHWEAAARGLVSQRCWRRDGRERNGPAPPRVRTRAPEPGREGTRRWHQALSPSSGLGGSFLVSSVRTSTDCKPVIEVSVFYYQEKKGKGVHEECHTSL